jgi:hypothetical protein
VQFINNLVNQLAAHQFLNIACFIEKGPKLSSAYSLLKAIGLELQSYLTAVDGRLVLLSYLSIKFKILFAACHFHLCCYKREYLLHRTGIIWLLKLHPKCLKKDLLMTGILSSMLWGIFLAVTRVRRIHMQFLLSLSSTSWNCSVILSFSVGSQAMTATYVSWYGMIEQISELQYELHNLQHELENVLPHERGRCIDELWALA